MDSLRFSVAMCTYRGERYLREQLDSIARQTRLPDELIIVDDDSQDATPDIISTFAASAPFPVTWKKNEKNIGSTLNFQRAISLCEGDIIVLSDQDDVWHADKLKLMEELFLSAPDTGAVFSNADVVSKNLSPLGYTLWDTFSFETRQKNEFARGRGFEVLLNHNVVTGATMAFRSSLRDRIFPIPVEWVHDGWIAMVVSITSDLKFIDRCLMDYRQHENQQLGGLKSDLAGKKRLAQSVTNYNAQIRQCELLVEHILRLEPPRHAYWQEKISEKISHLEARTAIYMSRGLPKAGKALRELLKGRYHKYSSGYASIVKDLFLMGKPENSPEKRQTEFPGSP